MLNVIVILTYVYAGNVAVAHQVALSPPYADSASCNAAAAALVQSAPANYHLVAKCI